MLNQPRCSDVRNERLSVRVPVDVPPGEHRMVIVLEAAPGGLAQPAAAGAISSEAPLRRQANLLVYDGAVVGSFFDTLQDIRVERLHHIVQGACG